MHRPLNKSPFFYILIAVLLTALLYVLVVWLTQPEQPKAHAPFSDVTMTQLLSVPEVTDKAFRSVVENNPKMLLDIQAELIATAEQLGFSDSQLLFLSSEQLLDYLIYHAKRELFNLAVQDAFINLERIDDIKTQYPEARDLFVEADRLIYERNQLIEQIAISVANQDGLSIPTEAHYQQAVELWRLNMSKTSQSVL